MDHYQNYKIYIPETGGVRTAATVSFFPKHIQMPRTSSEDRLAATLEDLGEILKKPHPKTPFLQQGTVTNDAIRKIREIFHPPKSDTVAASPRVVEPTTTTKTNKQAVPRVDEKSTRTTTNEIEKTIGTIVRKKFGKGIHRGEVKRYDKERKYYWIDYNNGDSEEMTHKMVKKYKYNDTDPDIIKRFTRSSIQQANLTGKKKVLQSQKEKTEQSNKVT